MSEEKRYFKFTVSGQYIALHEAGAKTLKRYTQEFVLPSQEAALSIICKHLLDEKLQKYYSDYIKFRTYTIISTEIIGRSPNRDVLQMGVEEMNREQLSDFCILRGIMIDPYKHGDLAHCREVVAAEWRLKRLAKKEEETSKNAEVNKEVDELRKLNGLPPNSDEFQVNINAQLATKIAQNPGVANPNRIPSSQITPGEMDGSPLPPVVEDEPVGATNGKNSDIIA